MASLKPGIRRRASGQVHATRGGCSVRCRDDASAAAVSAMVILVLRSPPSVTSHCHDWHHCTVQHNRVRERVQLDGLGVGRSTPPHRSGAERRGCSDDETDHRVASQQTHPPPLADTMPRSADGDAAVRSRAAARVAAPSARSGQTRLIQWVLCVGCPPLPSAHCR
jgi:hypothetical protein